MPPDDLLDHKVGTYVWMGPARQPIYVHLNLMLGDT
jgi:hypothetical protein